jgi:hypothetical protein
MTIVAYLIPGSNFHKRKQFLLGDIFNLIASFCLFTGVYWAYHDRFFESLYLLFIVFLLILINIWQLKSLQKQISEPAILEFQEKKFREILVNFLLGNESISLESLKAMVKTPHLNYEMEILLIFLLQRNANPKEANRLIKELNKNKLPFASESLLYSIKKQLYG